MKGNKKLKKAVREKARNSGVSYSTAYEAVRSGRDRGRGADSATVRLIKKLLPFADAFAAEALAQSGPVDAISLSVDDILAPRPNEATFERVLSECSLDELHRLETVMYVGRDAHDEAGASYVTDLHHSLHRHGMDLTVQRFSEKVPVARYWRMGVAFAAKHGVDLDALKSVQR